MCIYLMFATNERVKSKCRTGMLHLANLVRIESTAKREKYTVIANNAANNKNF